MQVDGEPWMQKKSAIDLLYHGQVPMLSNPTTQLQTAVSVMTESLEWAKVNKIIDDEQYQLIFNQYQQRMRSSIQ